MVTQHSTSEALFEETQQFRQPWLWSLMIGVFLFAAASFGWALVSETEKAGRGIIPAIAFGAIWIGTALFLLVLRLTVRVDQDQLHIRFFPFVNRHILLEDIARWEARTYRPILEYGGWGVRCSWSKGMAYNVSGNQGVQLELANGKRLLIGSQRPDELALAITQAKMR